MSDLLAFVLRDALHKRAAQLDAKPAVARLLSVDYRPRRRRLPVLPVLGTVGLGGAAATVVAVVTLGSSAAPALAGWTPVPTRATPQQTAAALARCTRAKPVLVDTRGPYTAAVYAMPHGIGTCVAGNSVFFYGTASDEGGDSPPVGPDQIQAFASTSSDSTGGAFIVLDGRVGPAVRGVQVQRNHASAVTASLSHGWYLAWWPDRARATTVRITTTSGTQTFRLPASATVGPASCGCQGGATASQGPGAVIGARGR